MARFGARDGVFTLDGRPWLWRAGEFQYFRIRPDLWRPGLEKLKAAGFNAISSYIPWAWHEPEEGALDFSGQTHPQRNLLAFLEACRASDLPLMARPGPSIYAEYRGFGHPRWLGEQYPDTVMRGPDGKLIRGEHYCTFAVMQATYLAKVERWYGALVDVLRPYFDHPVISFQLDNETGLMYGASLGKFDFNPDTIGRYRIFLHDTYGEIEALNAAWGTNFHAFGQILPPRGSWGRGEVVDWQRFLEDWLVSYLKYLRKIAGELGVPVPLAINESATYLSPAHPGIQSQVADVYGFALSLKSSGSPATADFPFLSSQAPTLYGAYATPERPAACLKLSMGWRDERTPIASEATVQAMLGCVAHNTRGYSLYIVHDGKDPEGEPSSLHTLLDEEGREQPSYEAVRGVQDFLARHEQLLLQLTEAHDSIAYLHYQPYSRLTIDEFSARRGTPEPAPFFAWRGSSGFYDLLVSAGYQPRFFDLEQVSDAQLAARRVAILPTKQYLDEASLSKLRRYVEQGGQLITLPGPIRQDAYGRPLPDAEVLYPYAEQSAQWLGGRQKMPGLLGGLVLRRLLRRGRQEQTTPEPMSMSDLVEWLTVGQVVNPPAARLTSAGGAAVRGDYRLICFGAAGQVPADQSILRAGSECAGYRVPVGQGTSTVLGTLPGGAYATSVYYRLAPEERAGLRRFAVGLMGAAGIQRQVVSDLEIETVRRRLPDGSWLLFLLNRLGEQRGELTLALEGLSALRVETLYRSNLSSAEVSGPARLSLRLAADDVLALHVLPA